MGYAEALEDNIRMVQNRNFKQYFPICQYCGEEVPTMRYTRGQNYTCQNCKMENLLADKVTRKEVSFESKERKLEAAIKRFEKMNYNLKSYETAINKVHDELHNVGWFDSTEEIMTAIQLEKNNVKYRHQVKFGIRYRADFVLDDEKIVLEIDGKLFHTKDKIPKETLRDNLIVLGLGSDWEVIRITDELINQNVKQLIPAIRKLKEKRQQIRKEYNGILPEWYSDRNV